MKPIIQDILLVSRTIVQAQHYIELWRTLTEQAVFTTDERSLQERFTEAAASLSLEDQAVVEQWSTDEWLPLVTAENFPTYVERLREWATTVPVFTVYVPVELPPSELRELARLLRDIKGGEWLLETKVDPNVIGGCAFIIDDVYYDYSLHGRLQRQPDIISDVLNAYEK